MNNISTVKRTSKKPLLMFIGDVKMGPEERKKTVIIFGTYGSKMKKVFPEGKEEPPMRAGNFFSKLICLPSHLRVMATVHLQDSARSSVTCLAGQQLWGVPQPGEGCGGPVAMECRTMLEPSTQQNPSVRHSLPYFKLCLVYS